MTNENSNLLLQAKRKRKPIALSSQSMAKWLCFGWFTVLLSVGVAFGAERDPSPQEFHRLDDEAKKRSLVAIFREWKSHSQNIIAKTSNSIRYVQPPKNGGWVRMIDVDMNRRAGSSWRCEIFRLNGQFRDTKIESNSFPVGLTHRSRTSCLPSASSNAENFNRLLFWLKAEFDEAVHFPFFETDRYMNALSFREVRDDRYVVVEFPIKTNNRALDVKRTMWLDATQGFLPARMKTTVTRDTRAGKSSVFGNTIVSRFKSVNGVVVPVEFMEYVTRPNMPIRIVPFFYTRVDEIKIRRKTES